MMTTLKLTLYPQFGQMVAGPHAFNGKTGLSLESAGTSVGPVNKVENLPLSLEKLADFPLFLKPIPVSHFDQMRTELGIEK